jgi:TIGR03009 family protein
MSQHLAFRRQPLAFRQLRRSCRIALIPVVVLLAIGSQLAAQDRVLDRDIAPNTQDGGRAQLIQDRDPGTAPSGRVARSSLLRPEMRVEPVDPEVDQLLFDWSEHTKRIKTLAGKHYRSTRDFAYGTMSLAEGKFFVEMPDKGRIDVTLYTAPKPKAGEIVTYPAPDGKPTKLTVKAEDKREKWICNGKVVRVIDDKRSTYEEVPIPPDQQGANMIDGPLPFLLGMPPDKAKARYRFKLLDRVGEKKDYIWIEVKPKLPLDAAEWVRAYLLLNLVSYLPERVSLFNPAGSTETVYIFQEIDVNKRGILQTFFAGDPFRPNVFGYKREVHAPPAGNPKNVQNGEGLMSMPSIVGDSSKSALRKQKQLQALGFEVEFKKGPSAPTPEQVFCIESQQPEANTPLRPGQKIILRYYDRMQTADKLPQQQQ